MREIQITLTQQFDVKLLLSMPIIRCLCLLLLLGISSFNMSISYKLLEAPLMMSLLYDPYTSLKNVLKVLADFKELQPCKLNNEYDLFIAIHCGLIRYRSEYEHYTWTVISNNNSTLEWRFHQVEIERADFHCSSSSVTFTSHQFHLTLCGFYLPWKDMLPGIITVKQKCKFTVKCQFLFFFTPGQTEHEYNSLNSLENNNVALVNIYRFLKRKVMGKLQYYLIGLHVMHTLKVTILQVYDRRYLSFIECSLYDGPAAVLTPLLYSCAARSNRCSSSIRTKHFMQTSSFQALLLLRQTFRHMKLSLQFRTMLRSNIGTECVGNERSYKICSSDQSSNYGLSHVKVYAKDQTVDILSFEFQGPNVFSASVDNMCQYGGLWILASSNLQFTHPLTVLTICPINWQQKSDWNLKFRRPLGSNYLALVTIQYHKVSASKLKYRYYYNSIFDYPGLADAPRKPFPIQLQEQRNSIFNIFNLRHSKNVSFIHKNAFSDTLTARVLHLAEPDDQFVCAVDIFYSLKPTELWCSSETFNHEVIVKKTIYSMHAGHQMNKSNQFKMDNVVKITLTCPKKANAFVNLQLMFLTRTNDGKEPLYELCHQTARKTSPRNGQILFFYNREELIFIDKREQFFFNILIEQKVKTDATLYECINGSRYTYTPYKTENGSLQFFQHACTEECLLAIQQNYDRRGASVSMTSKEEKGKIIISTCPRADGMEMYNLHIIDHSPSSNRYLKFSLDITSIIVILYKHCHSI